MKSDDANGFESGGDAVQKRILVITPTYYPYCGGAERVIFELHKHSCNDYLPDLICPNLGGQSEEFNDYFFVHRVCRASKNIYFKFFKYQFFQFLKAYQLSRKKKYALIHCHYILPTGIVGLLLKKILHIPLVITEHHFGTGLEILSENENPSILNPVMRFIASGADALVATGKTQSDFLQSLGKGKLNYEAIHLGGDCKVSAKSKEEIIAKFGLPRKKIIFSVSRLVKRKNYDLLIESANFICNQRKDLLFLIGGKGPEFDHLNNMIKKYHLEENVKLLGFVSDDDLEDYRKVADIFVSTSDFEGAGIIYFEAFAAKTPLFAKKNAASEEAVIDGYNGKLFNTCEELSRLILDTIDNEKELTEIKENAYKVYMERYNWKKHGDGYKKLYDRLTKQD